MYEMQILENEDQIRAAIAVMHPVARVAAQSLANHLLENPHIFQDEELRERAYFGACSFAMQQAKWDLNDQSRLVQFFENHGESVANVAMSIVNLVVSQAQKRKKWGWLGKAAAFTGGLIVASLFG
jgi:hypothetical protein